MSDYDQIHNLLHDQTHSPDAFLDSQYAYIQDNNNGQYNGQITYNGQTLAGNWITWSDSYLQLQFSVASSGAAYTATSLVALRESVLSLITGIQVMSNSNQTIVNDTSIQFINHLRLLIESNADWERTEMPELLGAFDKTTTNTVSPASLAFPAVQPNTGLIDRIKFFWAASNPTNTMAAASETTGVVNGANAFVVNCMIPLAKLHDFFKQLDFPIYNANFSVNFLYNYNNYAPLMAGGATPAPAAPVILSSRLYYKTVKLGTELAAKVSSRIQNGFTKTIDYVVTENQVDQGLISSQAGGQITQVISQGTIMPLRVWLLLYPNATLPSAVLPCAPSQALQSGNILVNSVPYYNRDLSTNFEFWTELKKQMPGSGSSSTSGSCLSYNDFVRTHHVHVWDVSRVHGRQESPTTGVNLSIAATLPNAAISDTVIIVERLRRATIDMSRNSTNITVV